MIFKSIYKGFPYVTSKESGRPPSATRPSLGSQRSQPSTVVKGLLLVPRDSYGVFTFMFSQKFSPNREGIELSTVVCMSSECVSYYGRMFAKCEFIDSTRSTDTGGVLEYGAHYPCLHDSYQTPSHMCRTGCADPVYLHRPHGLTHSTPRALRIVNRTLFGFAVVSFLSRLN